MALQHDSVKFETKPRSMDYHSSERGECVTVKNKTGVHPVLWYIMLLTGVLIYGSYTILVHLCEVDGKIPFSSASMVLVQESLKLGISIVLFLPEYRARGLQLPSLTCILPFAVPALLYCVNNNLAVHMQLQMDPATYQVLGNLKILTTAFLYRQIMQRPITRLRWVALALLALAGACNSYGGLLATPGERSAGVVHISVEGLVMICLYSVISGLAGVYSEYILKGRYEMSIHIQNAMLYVVGVILNGGTWLVGGLASDSPGAMNLLEGYSVYTWIIVISQALCGLIMSGVMKHGNNIVRLFLISCAMLVTTVMSMAVFSLQLNAYFSMAFVLVIIALVLYHLT